MRNLMLAGLATLLGGAGLTLAAEQTILGRSLVVKDPKPSIDATKRSVTISGGETGSPNLIVGDPTDNGAELVVDLVGDLPGQATFSLPQGVSEGTLKPFWTASTTGFTYKDAAGEQGPVSAVSIKRSAAGKVAIKVKISGKFAALNLLPPNPGTSGCAALTLGGGDRYSLLFGTDSTIKNDGAKLFSASKPTIEGVCVPDPCFTNNGSCDPLTTCTNDGGASLCGDCPGGYDGTGATVCVDVNECATNNAGCSLGYLCGNDPGTYQCQDINECATSNGGCNVGFLCANDPGTFDCRDINECAVGNGSCDPLTSCINTLGARVCGPCPGGYTGSGTTPCVDINECATNGGGCNGGFVCANGPGSHTCDDVNECATSNGGCDALTTCTNFTGGRNCSACPGGYTGSGTTPCVDINECATNGGGCDGGFVCANVPGSRTCDDVNECAVNNGGCPVGIGCINVPGGYNCN